MTYDYSITGRYAIHNCWSDGEFTDCEDVVATEDLSSGTFTMPMCTAPNQPPSPPTVTGGTGLPSTSVTVSATASDPEGSPLHYYFDFNSDGTNDVEVVAPSGSSASAQSPASWGEGTHPFQVALHDGSAWASPTWTSSSVTLTAGNQPPSAPTVAGGTGLPSTPVTVSAVATDPEGSTLYYYFDFNSDGYNAATGDIMVARPSGSSASAQTPASWGAGTHPFRVAVYDGSLWASPLWTDSSVTLTAGAPAPTAWIKFNNSTYITGVDPFFYRTWSWGSTNADTFTARAVITGCADATQNGVVDPWTPWVGGAGTSANGSSTGIPGPSKYSCVGDNTYTARNSATGQSTTANVHVAFRDVPPITRPTVDSPTATSITSTSAVLGANVYSDGGAALTERGTCWGTLQTDVNNCAAEGGSTTGVFNHLRTGLPTYTTIYYRGYADNSAGRGYSSSASAHFNTLSLPVISVVNALLVAPGLVRSGDVTGISWGVTGAQSCTVRGSNGDGTGSNSTGIWNSLTSGGAPLMSSPITGQTTYTLFCTAFEGSTPATYTDTKTVNILPIFRER